MTQANTGFIGLGAMGAPMANNLHAAGLLGAVWNRTTSRAAEFAASHDGVAAHHTLPDVAAACSSLVVCVSADEDLRGVVEAVLPHMAAGSLLVDCSTVASGTAQAMAAACDEHGVLWLDAPVSGGTEGAKAGSLSIMCGGSDAAFEAAQPVLQAMGANINHMGPAGAGQATKAVNQVLGAGINRAVNEALAFGEALGLPMDKVVDVVGAGASGNWFINHRGKTMLRGDYPVGFKVALHAKDLRICQAMAAQAGATLALSDAVLADFAKLIDAGHGDEDVSALYRVTRQEV